MAVVEFTAIFHANWCVSDERDAALTAVGVAGELKIDLMFEVEVIEGVRFVNEGDDGLIFLMAFPRSFGIGSPSPDGVEAIDEDVFSFDVEFCRLVLEVGGSGAFDLLFQMGGGAVPAVMVSGAGDDSLGGGDAFELATEFGERGGVIDDKVSGEGDEVGFFLVKGSSDFFDEGVVLARAVVDVGKLGEAEAIERFWPMGKSQFFVGD